MSGLAFLAFLPSSSAPSALAKHSWLLRLYFPNLKPEHVGGRFLSICLKKKKNSLCSLKIRSYLVIFSKGKVVWSQDFAVHLVSWSPYLGGGSLRCPEDSARASWDSPASHSRDSSLNLAAFLAWQMFPLQLLPSGNLAHNRLATYEPTAQQLPSSEPPPKGATLLLDASAF